MRRINRVGLVYVRGKEQKVPNFFLTSHQRFGLTNQGSSNVEFLNGCTKVQCAISDRWLVQVKHAMMWIPNPRYFPLVATRSPQARESNRWK